MDLKIWPKQHAIRLNSRTYNIGFWLYTEADSLLGCITSQEETSWNTTHFARQVTRLVASIQAVSNDVATNQTVVSTCKQDTQLNQDIYFLIR